VYLLTDESVQFLTCVVSRKHQNILFYSSFNAAGEGGDD
jgi:hypothetical protein